MPNPISPNPVAALPPFALPMVDMTTGSPNFMWYQFFLSAYNKLGGQQGLDLSTVQATAKQALAVASEAEEIATGASQVAVAADGLATQAEVSANVAASAASNAISLAQAVQKSSLQAASNLGDVVNAASARGNLGLNQISIVQNWDGKPAAGQVRYIPLARPYTVPASFIGSAMYCGTFASVDAAFTIGYIRSGSAHTIGTLTLVHAGNFTHATPQAALTLVTGDVLTITAPNPQDATLADVGLSLVLTLA